MVHSEISQFVSSRNLQEECEYWTLLYERCIGLLSTLSYIVHWDMVSFQLNRVFKIAVEMHSLYVEESSIGKKFHLATCNELRILPFWKSVPVGRSVLFNLSKQLFTYFDMRVS